MSSIPFLRLSAVVLALAAAPLAACGGDDDLTAGEFLTKFVDVYCGTAFECKDSFPNDLGVTHESQFGASLAECKTQFITGAQVQASVDAGKITFNASNGGTCVSKLEDLDCPGFWNALTTALPAECDAVTMGTVASGGVCTLTLECAGANDSCSAGTCTSGD